MDFRARNLQGSDFFSGGGGEPPLRKNQRPGRPTEIFDFAWSVAKRLACPLGKQPFRRAGRRPRLKVERVHTLSSSPGAVLLRDWFPTMQAVLLRIFVSVGAGVGRAAPLQPLGDGVREGCDPLVRSRGLVWRGIGFPLVREAVPVGISFLMERAHLFWQEFVSDGAGVGRSASLHPSGDGAREGCDPLALSGGCSFEKLVPDEAGRSFADFCFRRRGRGALCSPTPPLGRRGARGFTPSRALPGAGLAGNWFSAGAGSCSGGNFVSDGVGASVLVGVWFSTARGVGRSAPLQPLGRRVRESCDPLALSRGDLGGRRS